MMKNIFVLLLFCASVEAQGVFLPDSSGWVVSETYKDTLQNKLKENQDFVQKFLSASGNYFDNKFQFGRFANISIDALEMELFDQRQAQKKVLIQLEDTFLKDFLEKESYFQYWHLIFAHPIIRGNEDQKLRRLISLPAEITKGFKVATLKHEENLKFNAFRQLLPYYITYENSREHNFQKYSNMLMMANDKAEYAAKHLNGLVYDYAISQLLESYKEQISTSLAQNLISQIETIKVRERFTGKFIDEVIAENNKREVLNKEKAKKESSKNTLTFIDLDGKNFDLSKYKGKVIYLDFWASWCGPCKMQFPYSKKLHEEIPEKLRKHIVFLYISIDDTPEKWKEGIKSNGLEPFDHGYTEGAWSSPVLAKLGIRSIPRYMIIDKDGKIVDANAKRPSNPEILSELIKLAE